MKQIITKQLFCGCLLMFISLVTSQAQTTFTVSNTNNAGAGSLRQAILNANLTTAQDTIIFSGIAYPATIILTSGELVIDSNLVILGPGATSLAISGNNASRIFTVNDTTVMNGLTITNGNAGFGVGGGIYNNSSLSQTDCTLSRDSARSGGGIFNVGILTQFNCTFLANSAYAGGGIYNYASTLIQTNCTFSGNSVSFAGGGIYNSGIFTQTNCTLSRNSASFGGGIVSTSIFTQTNCTLLEDSADVGGGIHNSGTFIQTNCTLSGNLATNGGGIYNSDTLTQTNCTVYRNFATTDGGGIYNYSGTLNQTNCTLSGNSSTHFSGGIYNYSSSLTLFNTILNDSYLSASGTPLTSLGNNIFLDVIVLGSVASDRLSVTVSDLQIDTLKNNGGFTKTCALLAGSIAINGGSSSSAPTTDQRGLSRVCKVDIGAFEYQQLLTTNSTIFDTICNGTSYTFGSQTLTASGTYTNTIPNTMGCDSVITLHLVIKPNIAYIINDTICNGMSYSFFSQTLTTSGTYYDTINNSMGCKIFATLHLFVKPAFTLAITTSGSLLTATSGMQSYEWLKNGTPIGASAIDQTYIATTPGDYAVKYQLNGCMQTSSIIHISNVGIQEETGFYDLEVYPVPAKSTIRIQTQALILHIAVYDLVGQRVMSFEKGTTELNLESLASTPYILKIETNLGKVQKRIIKE